jgi:DNA modification methylase
MKTYLSLKNEQPRQLPEEFRHDDVRCSEHLVEQLLQEFTKPGDFVLDPFVGFGTTLLVAERLGRIAFGIEYEEKRLSYVRSILKHPERALHGDSTRLKDLDLPEFDFSITSPPYMGHHHKEDPFTAYTTAGDGYENYLATIRDVYSQLSVGLKPAGRAVVEISNLKHDDAPITTLAWDVAREISQVMRFLGEIVVQWEPTYGYGYDHSYCLVFSRRA